MKQTDGSLFNRITAPRVCQERRVGVRPTRWPPGFAAASRVQPQRLLHCGLPHIAPVAAKFAWRPVPSPNWQPQRRGARTGGLLQHRWRPSGLRSLLQPGPLLLQKQPQPLVIMGLFWGHIGPSWRYFGAILAHLEAWNYVNPIFFEIILGQIDPFGITRQEK